MYSLEVCRKMLCGEDWHDLMTWEEYLENIMVMSKTCLLEGGHKGEHEWTDDDEWGVTFKRRKIRFWKKPLSR